MTKIEELEMKLSHVKRDFNNLSEEYQYQQKIYVEYIRVTLEKAGYTEEYINQELATLAKPRLK